MEAIDYLTNWIKWLLLIIPVGAGTMVTYQAFRKMSNPDDGVISDANTKIRHTIIGAIIGVSISGIVTVVKTYFM